MTKALKDFIVIQDLVNYTSTNFLPLKTFKTKMTCECVRNIEQFQAYQRKRNVIVKNRVKFDLQNYEATRKLNNILKILDSRIMQTNIKCDECAKSRVKPRKNWKQINKWYEYNFCNNQIYFLVRSYMLKGTNIKWIGICHKHRHTGPRMFFPLELSLPLTFFHIRVWTWWINL